MDELSAVIAAPTISAETSLVAGATLARLTDDSASPRSKYERENDHQYGLNELIPLKLQGDPSSRDLGWVD